MKKKRLDRNAVILERYMSVISRLYHCGRVAGKIFCMLAVIDLFLLWLLDWLFPRKVRESFFLLKANSS